MLSGFKTDKLAEISLSHSIFYNFSLTIFTRSIKNISTCSNIYIFVHACRFSFGGHFSVVTCEALNYVPPPPPRSVDSSHVCRHSRFPRWSLGPGNRLGYLLMYIHVM